MKNYNPHWDDFVAKKEEHRKARLVVEQVRETLDWYEDFSLSKHEDDARAIRRNLSQARIRFFQEKIEFDAAINNASNLDGNVSSRLNPKSFFDKKAKKNRNLLSELKEVLKKKECSLDVLSREINRLTDELSRLEPIIDEYKEVDYSATCKLLKEAEDNLHNLAVELEKLNIVYNEAENVLAPLINEIKSKENDLNKLRYKISSVFDLESKLRKAENSYERRKVHEKCRELHGSDSPVEREAHYQRGIRTLERDIEKIERRLRIKAANLKKKYATIIVDGNNLCYEGGEFVGLSPVISVVKSIPPESITMVVFDANIRNLLKCNDDDLRKRFGENVKVHIVAAKQEADATIIALASKNSDSYIISNDRFVEYFDKEPVKDDRVIRHEIVDGSVIIHELGIHEVY